MAFDLSTAQPIQPASSGFDLSTAQPVRQNVSAEQPKSFGGFASNVLKSGGEMIGGLYHAVTNPIETVKNIGDIAAGGVYNVLPKNVVNFLDKFDSDPTNKERAIKAANAIGGVYKDRYGSLEALGNTLYTDPVGAAGDLATILSAGGGAITKAGKVAQLAPAAVVTGGLSEAPNIVRAANLAAPVARPIANAGKVLQNVGEATQTVGNYVNPLNALTPVVQVTGKALSYPANGLYNVVAPMFQQGAEGVKARGYLEALGNDPTKIDAAIRMLQQGKSIEETAIALNSSGLASFARTAQDASTVIRDLYNARDAALKSNQVNQLANATQNLNALNEANIPVSNSSPNAPRVTINRALSAEEQALENQKLQRTNQLTAEQQATADALAAEQARITGNVANVSQLETGQQLAKANEAILENTKKTVTGPAYNAAFEASPKATINVSNLATAAKGQITDLLTQLKGLAPNAAALLEEYGPKQVNVNMGNGVVVKAPAEPKLITLEDAHKIRQAINIDRAALKGSTEAAANTARLRLGQLYDEVNKSIKAGTSPEAFKLFEDANNLFKERIINVHRTGQPTNLSRTSTLNEPMLLPENIASTTLKNEGNTRQFLKIYEQDPAALQTLKTSIEDLYRQEVLAPNAGANAHLTFMFKNEKQLKALDEAGMNIRSRLETIGEDLGKVKAGEEALTLAKKELPNKVKAEFAAQDEALKLASDTLNFKNINDLRIKVIADPMTMNMALRRMDAPAKASLARGIMQDAMSDVLSGTVNGGAKALENLTKNESTIMAALKAHDPKTAAKTFADAKQMADLYRLVEETGNKLPTKPGTANALTTTKNLDNLTQGLPEVRAAVEKIQQELQTNADFEKLAAQGKAAGGGASKLLTQEIGKQPTGFFGHTWSIANLLVNRLKGSIDNKLAVQIAQELSNSETAAAALSKAQARNVKLNAIKEPIKAGAENALNALTSRSALGVTQLNQQNQNALAR